LPIPAVIAQISKPRTREAVLGLFPQVSVREELMKRPPGGNRKEQPIDGNGRERPCMFEHPSPRQTDDAKPCRSEISDQERRECECLPELLFPGAVKLEKLAGQDVPDH
jgi:hypothetical protein